MTQASEPAELPDLAQGVSLTDLAAGKLLGLVGDSQVLLLRTDGGLFAIDAQCSHYHGPLAEGLVVGNSIRCPWHHACFDLRTGEALRAPALAALSCWKVEQLGARVIVREKQTPTVTTRIRHAAAPQRVVIVGGGAAGFAAAEMLRRERFAGSIVMLSQEAAAPVDRPNLSKDYLAGDAPEDWLPLRPDDYYKEQNIELRLTSIVTSIDAGAHKVLLSDGSAADYDALLLACGAEPVRLTIPGADQPCIYTLRTLADCRAIIQSAQGQSNQGQSARRALVIGGSFIGLEAAAALRKRGIEVHVVTQDKIPMQRVFGAELGSFVRALHEEHGVVFHLADEVTSFGSGTATLRSGKELQFDFAVVGIGVRPRMGLADQLGVARDRGVLVDAQLRTSIAGIYAAGDIARWPDPHTGQSIRVEHWVVAQRQGQTVARNILGQQETFKAVPFFWSQHYDVAINYVGHAERWDELVVEGDINGRDCLLKYKLKGRTLAVASIFRDLASLQAELAMEQERG